MRVGANQATALPSGWQARRLRFETTLNPSKQEIRDLPQDALVSFVPMEAIGELGGIRLDEPRPLGDLTSGYSYFRDGDVITAKITPCFENGKGALASGLANGVGFGTTELHVLRAGPQILPRWLFYLTLSHSFRVLGASEMYGAGGQKRVPESFFRDFVAAVPPLAEQSRIVSHLDRRTSAIDELIKKKKRLVELLQEKRQALITQAVTKGLDSKVPMKESGVPILDRIPSPWTVTRVKFVITLATSGSRGWAEYYSDVGPLFLQSGNLDGLLGLDLQETQRVALPVKAEGTRTRVVPGDVLVCITGALTGNVLSYNRISEKLTSISTFACCVLLLHASTLCS